ncbi:CAP-associated domain-containing protein [Caldibacillus lycopersici]|uniref:CAP-associated domain-containing protein n=1 Tax=Perspicuibacillus lycopersici TaxID=1325689 RepID=A0AAE3IQA1_9BACI|nr:CAP domain-containing protein [Perspicuibacillus lycopersici]MCU9612227.1 CAP-associated domain-containing protein [Perspicuibacillus lycopersici]
MFYGQEDDVLVSDPSDAVVDEDLDVQMETEKNPELTRPEKGISTYIGKSTKSFQEKFGEPARTDQSYYGYELWIYNKENQYMQVGVVDNKVVTISVVGKDIDASPFEIGENLESVYKKVSMQPIVELADDSGDYRFELFENDLNTRPLIPFGDIYAQLYFDSFEGELLFVRFMDKETLLKLRPYDLTYRGELVESEPLTEEQWKEADLASEQEIFELTNIVRKRYELPQLQWDDTTADVAYYHSQDMYETENFSHVSEKYGDLADRLEARSVFYEAAGENIAYLYNDSIAVIAGWLNSQGHRETFLSDEFTHLGVGVYYKYYTQNFIRQTWEE